MTAGGWDLVRRAQEGDSEAFGHIYERYQGQVRAFLGRRVRDRELVEDLTAETFTRALVNLRSVSVRSDDLGAWLNRIARNLLFDHWKSSQARLSSPSWDIPEPRAAENPGPEDLVHGAADRAVAVAVVARCLAALTPTQLDAVTTFYFDPDREQEHANATRHLRGRAIRTMRTRLAREGLTSSGQCFENTPVLVEGGRVA